MINLVTRAFYFSRHSLPILLMSILEFDDPPRPDPRIPAHTQGTERLVQLCTNVSRQAIEENRDNIMAVTLQSRARIPRMESKRDLRSNS